MYISAHVSYQKLKITPYKIKIFIPINVLKTLQGKNQIISETLGRYMVTWWYGVNLETRRSPLIHQLIQ